MYHWQMASKRCPACGLVSPATAEICDCGRSFADGTIGAKLSDRLAKPLIRVKASPAGWVLLGLGAAVIALGLYLNTRYEPNLFDRDDQPPITGTVLLVIGTVVAAIGFFVRRASIARAQLDGDRPD